MQDFDFVIACINILYKIMPIKFVQFRDRIYEMIRTQQILIKLQKYLQVIR